MFAYYMSILSFASCFHFQLIAYHAIIEIGWTLTLLVSLLDNVMLLINFNQTVTVYRYFALALRCSRCKEVFRCYLLTK